MADGGNRRPAARRRRQARPRPRSTARGHNRRSGTWDAWRRRVRQGAVGGLVFAIAVMWSVHNGFGPYLVAGLLLAALALGVWWLWRTDRLTRAGDRRWRAEEAVRAGHRSMAGIDALSWQDFERYVAELCRRDGCVDVEVSGRSGDLGADVTGRLPDGRLLVVQCKHYAPHRYVPSGDMQKFLGTAWLHHGADVAVFVATCPFGRAALDLAVRHGVLAVHRDLLGLWNSGTPLTALLPLNGAGQGGRTRRRGGDGTRRG